MNVHSHYETLSVARDAPQEVIRAAYKALSQKWHPDRNVSPDAADVMLALNAAYAELSDADKRFQYDQILKTEAQQPQPKRGRQFDVDWDAVDQAVRKQRSRFKPRSAAILSMAAAAMSLVGIISSRSP